MIGEWTRSVGDVTRLSWGERGSWEWKVWDGRKPRGMGGVGEMLINE